MQLRPGASPGVGVGLPCVRGALEDGGCPRPRGHPPRQRAAEGRGRPRRLAVAAAVVAAVAAGGRPPVAVPVGVADDGGRVGAGGAVAAALGLGLGGGRGGRDSLDGAAVHRLAVRAAGAAHLRLLTTFVLFSERKVSFTVAFLGFSPSYPREFERKLLRP